MKKILCLVLTLIMVLSSFAMCLSVSAKGEEDFLYRPDGTGGHEDIVGKVIDPIVAGKNTVFADSINELGFSSVNKLEANGQTLTKENFDSFITANASDKMFGIDFDFLYSKNQGSFFWNFTNYKLEKSAIDIQSVLDRVTGKKDHLKAADFILEWNAENTDPVDNTVKAYSVHDIEGYAAEKTSKVSTCIMKGEYDACAEVLNGYRYSYEQKEVDKEIFADIIEERVVIHNDYTNRDEIHYNYYYDFSKGSFSLIRANANNQIINTISKTWKNDAFFKDTETANKNAVKIANFIGNLLYPNFVEIPEGTEVFTDNKKLDAYDFFARITEVSGLEDILQNNWCEARTFNVKDIMKALGVNIADDVLLNVETEKGVYMGARILTDMFREFFENPVVYVEQLIQLFSKSYGYTYQRAIEALFVQKYPSMAAKSREGAYPKLDPYNGSELKSVDGLINFITDCIYVEKVDAGQTNAKKFSFAPLPVNRIVNAADADELHLYFLCWFELNRVYGENKAMIETFISDIVAALKANYKSSTNSKPKDIEATKKVLRTLFLGEFTMVDVFTFHLGTLTDNTINNFTPSFFNNLKNSIVTLFQKFIDAMDSFMNLLFGWTGGILG